MQEDAVALLSRGVINVMRHLEMIESVADATATANDADSNTATTLLTKFEWLYTKSTGVWYPKVAPGDAVGEGERIGTVGDLFGELLEEIVSPVNGVVLFPDDQSIRARERVAYGNRSGIRSDQSVLIPIGKSGKRAEELGKQERRRI
jgi:Predicted deacylase